MPCNKCEVHPVAKLNGLWLCSEHLEQWTVIEGRHAPNDSFIRSVDKISPQQGLATHKPRHY